VTKVLQLVAVRKVVLVVEQELRPGLVNMPVELAEDLVESAVLDLVEVEVRPLLLQLEIKQV
jgi:uncharacterized membrane protein YvlD (DUF360 family)